MNREIAAAFATSIRIGLGGLLMFSKNTEFKQNRNCGTCKYESLSIMASKCSGCRRQKGSNWHKQKEPEPKPAYCECCGAEKQ